MNETADWTVHKFGGTSLETADRIRSVADIVESRPGRRTAVVVSAMGGVTDDLLGLLETARQRDTAYRSRLEEVRRRHLEVLDEILAQPGSTSVASRIKDDFRDIEDVLRAIWLLGEASQTARELIAGYGELWAARILAGCLASRGHSVDWLDARDVVTVESGDLGPVVDWEATREKLEAWMRSREPEYLVVTGYIASTREGVPTTLGRNGSDFSASIVGALLGASSISLWSDVDGVMSADPSQVPDAEVLGDLSFEEAMELAYFGAGVIHPNAMTPAVDSEIPIYIRNTFDPEVPGTRIHAAGTAESAVKGFATIDSMALCNLEGAGMMGVPGIANRLFGALREADISVVMISQDSSEHSICFAVPESDAPEVSEVVEQAFFSEFHHGQLERIEVTTGCSILAVVGDGMSGIPGVAAEFFGALGKAGVNIKAIAQGSSERNISVVIDGGDRTRALRAAHSGFYLSNQTLSVGLIGPGNVGATLLDQLGEQVERLADEDMVDVRLRGMIDGSHMLLDQDRIGLDGWRETFEAATEEADLDRFVDHVQTDYHPHAVLIDCTASEGIARRHVDWIERGIHVVTPNKLGCAGPIEEYRTLRERARESRMHYLYETTVGAGLPILQTLRDIRETGDAVISVEGILSGTFAYLFNAFDGTRPFSEIVREAQEKGFTEPDPRDDLSGKDVGRKLTILAREMGLDLEVEDVDIEGMVPEGQEDGSVEAFLDNLEQLDEEVESMYREAAADGQVLRYVGRIDRDGEATVGLRRYPEDHAFAQLKLTDNIVQFRTRRYDDNPLVVQGPGAGPEVTAGGVFADLLRLATYLGGSS